MILLLILKRIDTKSYLFLQQLTVISFCIIIAAIRFIKPTTMEKQDNNGIRRKYTFTGSPDDFVEFVRLLESMGGITNMQTGRPATREEIANKLTQHMVFDLGGYEDYRTLELCSKGSDFGERALALMREFREEGFPGLSME